MKTGVETASISANCRFMRITEPPGMIVAHCAIADENPSKCRNYLCGAARDPEAQKTCNKFIDVRITWNETYFNS